MIINDRANRITTQTMVTVMKAMGRCPDADKGKQADGGKDQKFPGKARRQQVPDSLDDKSGGHGREQGDILHAAQPDQRRHQA
jgi:hypothetical protein